MSLSFTFAKRYFRAKKNTNAINIISFITASVIAFSTMCQVLVLSVFNGFEDIVKSLYSDFYTDLRILPATGKTMILSADTLQKIKAVQGVKGICTVAEDKALLQNGELQTVVFLKGVDNNYQTVSAVPRKIRRGNFDIGSADKPLLVMGAGVENAVGAEADKNFSALTVFLPRKHSGSDVLSSISEGNAYTAGTFAIQEEFDSKYVITNIGFVRQQMNLTADEISALEISLTNPAEEEAVIDRLKKLLPGKYKIRTRFQQNMSLYTSMQVEKWATFAVLTLILIIAAFNMISALTMLVLEKKKDISIVQSMGGNKNLILKIFLNEGLILAGTGAAAGVILAVGAGLLQIKFKWIKLTGSSFLIDYFPVKFMFRDFVLVSATAFLIALIASWMPAYKASRQPVQLKNQ